MNFEDDRDGLTLEDLAWAYPPTSQCASLGHPVVKVPGPERFANGRDCICGAMGLDREGVKRWNPDPSDYR